jgi:molybdate transport system regulatory protein
LTSAGAAAFLKRMAADPLLQPRLRFPNDSDRAFGPGKAELLGAIASTGSIRSAAAQMHMSYNRAWTLVRAMNTVFRGKLVVATRGGGTGGGAILTPLGRQVLKRYTRMERACLSATLADWRALRALLAKR